MSIKAKQHPASQLIESKLHQWWPAPTVLKDGVNIPHKTLAKNIGISKNRSKKLALRNLAAVLPALLEIH